MPLLVDQKEVEKLEALYAALFDSPMGREVLNDLTSRFCVFSTTLPGGVVDGISLAYNEGQRTAILYILHRLSRGRMGHEWFVNSVISNSKGMTRDQHSGNSASGPDSPAFSDYPD